MLQLMGFLDVHETDYPYLQTTGVMYAFFLEDSVKNEMLRVFICYKCNYLHLKSTKKKMCNDICYF